MSFRRVRLVSEAEDIYIKINNDEPPEVIVYHGSAFVWSFIAQAYMEKCTLFLTVARDD